MAVKGSVEAIIEVAKKEVGTIEGPKPTRSNKNRKNCENTEDDQIY